MMMVELISKEHFQSELYTGLIPKDKMNHNILHYAVCLCSLLYQGGLARAKDDD